MNDAVAADYSWAIVLGGIAVLLAGVGAFLANKNKKSKVYLSKIQGKGNKSRG